VTYRVGVDVGGTFTDCVLRRPDGTLVLEKALTTPGDESDGVLAGLGQLAGGEGITLADLLARTRTIVHGTTTGDNTMIQMTGAPTGLLVTDGFRDEVEMRRCYKEDIWDPALPPPTPIARRRVRLEVRERMTAEGDVLEPLDEEAVRKATERLRNFGVTSIAISFLHSFLNPAHELRARELVLDEYPDVEMVSLSHEVLPKPPEFERTSTTLVNAYVGPPIARYLARLTARLGEAGYHHELLVATSAGGVATAAVATIGSGPTGGVSAAARAARAAGLADVVSVDMGGTSYDVCLIRDGRPEIKMDWNWRHRYCIGIPMVDIPSVGAGGGSVAWEEGGVLHVGPQSAGSRPGPVCYGRGGTEPTVTDADLVLGRLDPNGFAHGRMVLDVGAAHAAFGALGARVGLDAEATAVATLRLVDAHMTDAVRRVLSLAGVDPRRLDLVAFGGMGAVHSSTQGARPRHAPRARPRGGCRPVRAGSAHRQSRRRRLAGIHRTLARGRRRCDAPSGHRARDLRAGGADRGRGTRRSGDPRVVVAPRVSRPSVSSGSPRRSPSRLAPPPSRSGTATCGSTVRGGVARRSTRSTGSRPASRLPGPRQ
jgi:N-methylhydantoinase A